VILCVVLKWADVFACNLGSLPSLNRWFSSGEPSFSSQRNSLGEVLAEIGSLGLIHRLRSLPAGDKRLLLDTGGASISVGFCLILAACLSLCSLIVQFVRLLLACTGPLGGPRPVA